jgi:hypothetical protein
MRAGRGDGAEPDEKEIRGEILRQLMELGRGSSICPSEAARELFPRWREKMELIRSVVVQMVIDGELEATQRGELVDVETAKGPIRLRLPAPAPGT